MQYFPLYSERPAHLPGLSGSETPIRVKQEGYAMQFITK
jgi:hypothetical protein